MASKPKKWRLTTFPGLVSTACTSKADAYRCVAVYAARVHEDNASGRYVLRVQSLTVQVDERDGAGWQAYERFTRDQLVELHTTGV